MSLDELSDEASSDSLQQADASSASSLNSTADAQEHDEDEARQAKATAVLSLSLSLPLSLSLSLSLSARPAPLPPPLSTYIRTYEQLAKATGVHAHLATSRQTLTLGLAGNVLLLPDSLSRSLSVSLSSLSLSLKGIRYERNSTRILMFSAIL